MAQVQIGSTLLKLSLIPHSPLPTHLSSPSSPSSLDPFSDLSPTLTVADLIAEASNLLIKEYSPHLLSCSITSLSFRTKKLAPTKHLVDILHGQIHHLIFVATEFTLTFYLSKPLGLKLINLNNKQLLIGKVLEIDESNSQASQNCLHDLLVRGMEIISCDSYSDLKSILLALCDKNSPLNSFHRLEVKYPGKAMLGYGISGGYREVPLRLLQIYLSLIDGLKENVGVQDSYYCVIIVGNHEYTEQTPVMKCRNGKLAMKHLVSIPVPYSAINVKIELYQSNLLKNDVLVGSILIKLRDLKPKGDTILQLPFQGTEAFFKSSPSLLPPTPLRRDSHPSFFNTITLHMTCTLPSNEMISLLEEIAPRPQDLVFHQQQSIGSSSLKGIYAEDFYFLNDSLKLGHPSTTSHDVSLYISNLFFHPPVMKKKLSPCMFVIQNSTDDRLSESFGSSHVDPALRVSTRVATMMTGSLKRLYSPEQVCNTLSVCLYSDQLVTYFTATHPSLNSWTTSSLKNGEYSFKITLVADLSPTLECPVDKGYEFIVNSEELYWDWFEALTAAFSIRNRVWTDDSLTFTEDFSGVLTWRKWKVKPSLSSTVSYDIKEKIVSSSINVKGAVMTLQIPKSQGPTKYQTVTLSRDAIYSLQFSHSLQDRFYDQIRVTPVGVVFPKSSDYTSTSPSKSYELHASIGGIKLSTRSSHNGNWNSNFYFSTNGCNVRHGWFPPADVTFQLYQSITDGGDKHLVGSATLAASTGESSSDFHKHTATSRRLSIYHKNSIERTLSHITSPPSTLTVPMIPDFSRTNGVRIRQISVMCPRDYAPLKKGVYLVLHLVSKSKGLIKTSKMRTSTLFRELPQWDSEIIFRSEEGLSSTLSMLKEYSGICIRLMQHGKLRSTLLHEYIFGLGSLTQNPTNFTIVAEGKSTAESVPEIRVTAELISNSTAETKDNPEEAITLVYNIESCQLDEDNTAWSSTIFSRSHSGQPSESESCHVHINDNGLSIISSCFGRRSRILDADDSLFFLEVFTSLRDIPDTNLSKSQSRISIKQITAYVMEIQALANEGTFQLSTSTFFDINHEYLFPFQSLEEAMLPAGYSWSSKWFYDTHKKSDREGWVYGSSHWAIASGYGSPVSTPSSSMRIRVWKRFFLKNSLNQYSDPPASTLCVSEFTERDTDYGSLDGDRMFIYEDLDAQSGRSAILRRCFPSVCGCVHIPYSSVMSVVVLCPTVVKCVVIGDMLINGHIHRVPLKLIIGSCPAVQIASLIQDHHSLLPIRSRLDDLKQLSDPSTCPEQVLEVARVIIHSLSALEDYTYECSPFIRSQIVKRRHRLIGCLVSLRRRYAHLFSSLFDLSNEEELEKQADSVAASVVASGGVEEIIETVKRYCGALSDMLRKAVISQPQGSDPDTRAYVENTISKIVNLYYSRIVQTIGTIVSNRDEVSKLKGQNEKLQLLFFIMKEDDVVERILRRYLPLLGFETFPPALLTMVIGIEDLIGRFINVMEDEVKMFCDRVLNYHLTEGNKLAAASSEAYHPLWPILSREKLFQSSIPEDIVSAVRLFIESVMQDHGSVDEGLYSHQRAAQLKLDLRPKRRGKKNVATADGSQHSKFRVLQFQGHILGAIASTLVWLRDAISSIVASSRRKALDFNERDSRANQSELLRAHFDCSIMNDCLRFLTVHLPSMESDFDGILSEAVSSGVSLNSSYVAYFELLQQSAQRVASSIFEDIVGIFDISTISGEKTSKLTKMWMSPDENEEHPFALICSVTSAALVCLRDWIHPQGFTILLSDVVCNICTLLLFVAKEIALSKPDLLQSSDVTEESRIDDSHTLAALSRDISLVRDLFVQFHDPRAESELAAKLSDITGITLLSGQFFIDSLTEFETLLKAPIPSFQEESPANATKNQGDSLVRCYITMLEGHRLVQGSVTAALKCALTLRQESIEDRKLVYSMLMSSLSDREQRSQRSRKHKPHHDLFARVFGDLRDDARNPPKSNTSNPVEKTINFFKKAVTQQSQPSELSIDSSLTSWFPYQHTKLEKKALTADDILLSFGQGNVEDTQQSAIPSISSLSLALIDIGRQVISSPTKPQMYRESSALASDQFIAIQVVEARGFSTEELVGKSSPYVTIQLIRSGSRYRAASTVDDDSECPLRQTKVVLHKINPYFGETFRFSPSDLAGVQIEVKVWNWSRYFRHTLLGCKTINISGISSSRYEDFWIDLEAPVVGNASSDQEGKPVPADGDSRKDYGRVHLVITLSKLNDHE